VLEELLDIFQQQVELVVKQVVAVAALLLVLTLMMLK
jgi:hypothetical protein